MDEKIRELEKQAEEILRQAEESGVLNNFLFTHTFNTYLVQIKALIRLDEEIEELGDLVIKEYVKGRPALVVNPAITAFNNTANSAGKSVQTLIRIIKEFKTETTEKNVDPLLSIINGGGK